MALMHYLPLTTTTSHRPKIWVWLSKQWGSSECQEVEEGVKGTKWARLMPFPTTCIPYYSLRAISLFWVCRVRWTFHFLEDFFLTSKTEVWVVQIIPLPLFFKSMAIGTGSDLFWGGVCMDKQDPCLGSKGPILDSKIVLVLKVNCCQFRTPRPTEIDIGVPWSSLQHHLPLIIPIEVFEALHCNPGCKVDIMFISWTFFRRGKFRFLRIAVLNSWSNSLGPDTVFF